MKRFSRKRKNGFISFGVMVFSFASIISTGFSTWIIGNETTEAQINVGADDLIDLNEYFLFVDSPTIFEYTSNGLVKDHVISSASTDGYIEIPFRIDTKGGKIRDHLSSRTGFTLGTVLVDRNQNLDLFSVCSATEVKLAISAATNNFSDTDYTIVSQSNVVANKELSSSFDLSVFPYLDESLVYFSVRYKVNFNVTDFKKYVYDKLSNGSFRFSFKAGGFLVMNKIKKLPLFLSTSSLLAYVGYGSWVLSSFKESNEFSTKPAREVCYIKNSKGTTRYTSLDYALKIAEGNGVKDQIFVLPQDGTSACRAVQIKESHTIKNGDSLKLPYESETTKPSDFTGSSVIDSSETNVNTYRRTLVEMINGSKLTVESGGSLIVGGVFNTVGVTGKYAEITLDSNSSIICNGTMEVYGYIKEKTSSSKFSSKTDGKEMNENDSGRYVEFGTTGSLTCPLAIKDASSGGVMTSLNESGVCPTNEFNIQSIQTYTTFKYGSKAVALARMSAAGQTMEKQCGFIGKDGPTNKAEENCVFYLKSGSSLSMEYVPANPGVTNPAPKADFSKYVLNGQISLGSLYLDVKVTTIDTTKYYFPLSYLMNLYIENGGEFTLDHQLKIYPGSSLNIKKGGKLSLNSDLVVYTCADLANFDSSSSFYYPVATIGVDGKLVDNGLFSTSSKGHFGGQVTHTNLGGSSADFSSADAANLIATSTEGTKKVAVNKQATGVFKTSHGFKESLIAPNQVVTSAKENEIFYWNGKYETTVNVSVQLTKQYDNNVYGYTISCADDASGTNTATLSAENSTDIKSYQVSNQKYVRFQTKRTADIQVDFGDGVRKEINQSVWYKVGDDDIHVYITPFEGVSVDITTNGNSGSGRVKYTLYESETQNGAFEQIGYNNTGKLQVNVIKGRYFKFTTKSDYLYWFTTKPVLKDGVNVGTHGKEKTHGACSGKNLGNDIVYYADGNYVFNFGWHFPF